MTGASHTLEVPIEEALTPNVHVQVDLVGAAPRTSDAGEPDPKAAPRPAFAAGAVELRVPPRQRTLALRVTPRETALAPGGETVLDLDLRDAAGRPVADGEVAVVVVDEAVLALTGYRLPDPLAVFYARRDAGVSDRHLRRARPAGPTGGSRAGGARIFRVAMEAMLAVPPPRPGPLRHR